MHIHKKQSLDIHGCKNHVNWSDSFCTVKGLKMPTNLRASPEK